MPKKTNDGLRKICGCPRRQWTKCAHPWHFNFCNGKDAEGRPREFRFSLHVYADKPRNYTMAKTEAEALRDQARAEIRAGKLTPKGERVIQVTEATGLTLDDVIAQYLKDYVRVPSRRPYARSKFEEHLDWLAEGHVAVAGAAAAVRLGSMAFAEIKRPILDAVFDARLSRVQASQAALQQVRDLEGAGVVVPTEMRLAAALARRAPKGGLVSLNRFKARVRHLFNWAIGKGYRDDTPFKRFGVSVIRLDTRAETERTRRLPPVEEERLFESMDPHLRAVVTAALSTGCRIGELLSLQWAQVRFDAAGQPRAFVLPGSKTKTATARVIPIGQRLRAILDLRGADPDGDALPPDAFVFGTETGERVASVRASWERACARAGITDLHVHDLRREFASRLLESGAELTVAREFLGHTSIATTSKYLRSTTVRLENAIDTMEAATPVDRDAEIAALRARLAALEATPDRSQAIRKNGVETDSDDSAVDVDPATVSVESTVN